MDLSQSEAIPGGQEESADPEIHNYRFVIMSEKPYHQYLRTVSAMLAGRIGKTVRWMLVTVLSLSFVNDVRADRLIGVSKSLGHIADINPATGVVSNRVSLPNIACTPAYDIVSLATHPDTGIVYGILNDNPSTLMTVNTGTGVVTPVASTGVAGAIGWISTITFGAGPGYPLYAIVGGDSDGGAVGSIHTLNPATGQPTATGWSTSGSSGGAHALEFNPDDGLLYHFYNDTTGGDGTTYLETIDPSNGTVAAVALSGDDPIAVNAITYMGSNTFVTFNRRMVDLYSITTAGVVTKLSSPVESNKTRAIDYVGPNTLLVHDDESFYNLTLGTLAVTNRVPFGPSTTCPPPLYSIAKDPTTGDYYIISDPAYPDLQTASHLAKVNIDTGALSGEVELSEPGIYGITFGPTGQMYGIASLLPQSGGTIEIGTIVTIDKTTGTVADPGWNTPMNDLYHSIEYNPDDGLLYRFYRGSGGVIKLDKIDPTNGAHYSEIDLSPQPVSTSLRGVVYKGEGEFYVVDSGGNFYTITTTGVTTAGGTHQGGEEFFEGLELAADKVVASNSALKALLLKKLKKLKKQLKAAKKSRKVSKVKKIKKKIKKVKKQLRALG